jgi:phosphoribosyl 1,2-cyclic phosphate phosphodiesterase
MKVIFLGTGTSFGVPSVGCSCRVCRSDNLKNKRLRSSVYVVHNDVRFLVDCSNDLRQQALLYEIVRVDGVFFTHNHADHFAGIDELRIFNLLNENKPIDLFADRIVVEDVRRRYDYFFHPIQIGGGVPNIDVHLIEGEFDWRGIHIVPLPVRHGNLDILGFRFNDFVYVTDASFIPEETMAKMHNAQLLVLNALRRRPHSTHFSVAEALNIAQRLQPKQTYFTHMCHDLDHDEVNASLPPDCQLAYDGLTVEIP